MIDENSLAASGTSRHRVVDRRRGRGGGSNDVYPCCVLCGEATQIRTAVCVAGNVALGGGGESSDLATRKW